MSTLDWMMVFAAIIAAWQMKDALSNQAFVDKQKNERPRAHTFN